MKTLFLTLSLIIGLSFAAMGQCGNVTILSGCVGACGTSFTATYTVQPGDVGANGVGYFCLSATSNSLCPSHNAAAVLDRNASDPRTGNLDLGDVVWHKALVGDVLDVQVNTVLVFPKISCFWFGETQFSLMRL